MSYFDEEGESVARNVTEYYFEDEHGEPISFSELPVQCNESENMDMKMEDIVLRGKIDNGIQDIYVPVTAWKFDLSKPKLRIFSLSKNNWIQLEKPKRSYEENYIRTILITLHFLHFWRNNPRSSSKALWDHLSQVYRYMPRPSEKDLVDHIDLIGEALKLDKVLAKSEFVVTYWDEKSKNTRGRVFDEDAKTTGISGFIDDDMTEKVEGGCSDDDEQKGVCDICDDGGNIIRCEGECLRSFHLTEEDNCESLRLSDAQVEAINYFYCKNCKYKRHQCFVCKKLGSSDKDSAVTEVFRCVSGECGRFYHPSCVSRLLCRDSEADAGLLEEKIANGASFTCPTHKCCVCNEGEIENDDQLRFAVCRRCPKSYHRKCLPRELSFESKEDEVIIPRRAWDTLLPKNRILIYCLEHDIDEHLGTPIRNHVKFPCVKKKKATDVLPSGEKSRSNKKTPVPAQDASTKKSTLHSPMSKDKMRAATKLGTSAKRSVSAKRSFSLCERPDSSKRQKLSGTLAKRSSIKVQSATNENKTYFNVTSCTKEENLPSLDAKSEKRIMDLIKDVSSSTTLEDVYKERKRLTTHGYSSQNVVDKNITLGKVEGSVEALHAALEKLEEGCSNADAKAVCGPGLLRQMMQWKTKLKIYLAPFLLGMHYASYGHHFTKSDELQKSSPLENNEPELQREADNNRFDGSPRKKREKRRKESTSGSLIPYKNVDTPVQHTTGSLIPYKNVETPLQHTKSHQSSKNNIRIDSLGFVPGPYTPSMSNSAGWLEE